MRGQALRSLLKLWYTVKTLVHPYSIIQKSQALSSYGNRAFQAFALSRVPFGLDSHVPLWSSVSWRLYNDVKVFFLEGHRQYVLEKSYRCHQQVGNSLLQHFLPFIHTTSLLNFACFLNWGHCLCSLYIKSVACVRKCSQAQSGVQTMFLKKFSQELRRRSRGAGSNVGTERTIY